MTGWWEARELIRPDAAAALVDAAVRAAGGGPRAAHATLLVEGLASRLALAAAGRLLAGEPAPDLDPAAVRVRVGPGGAVEEVEVAGGDVPAGAASVAAVREGLAAHLVPLVGELAAAGERPALNLWRAAGDGIASAVLRTGCERGCRRRAEAVAEAVLAPPAPYAVALAAHPDGDDLLRARAGCCLSYRVPPDHVRCDDCPAGRLRRIAALRHRVERLR